MKKKLPPLTPAHQAFNKQTATAEDQTTRYVIPLYAIDENNERYSLGSAVLLKIKDKKFLSSAAHVFDENKNPKNPTNIEIPGKNTFIPIPGQVLKTGLPASGKREDDPYDIAVVQLNDDIAEQLNHHEFLTINQVDPSDKPYKQSLYTFTGYPGTKQKMPKGDALTLEPVRYTSMPLPPEKYPSGFQLGPHHAIDFDKKKMIARNGKLQTPPDPHGVSGGGLFRLGTFNEIKNGQATPTLVGIAIETQPGCLLATNITFALELIKSEHPDLDDEIPHSEYCKLDITKK